MQGEDRSSGSEHCPHNTTTHSYVLQISPINKENQAKSAASLVQWNIYPAAAFYWVYGSDLLTSLTICSLCGDTNTASPASRSCTWQAVCVPVSVWSLDKQAGNAGESHHVKDPLLFYSPFASSAELPVSQARSYTSLPRPLTSYSACIWRPFYSHGLGRKIGP